MLALAAFGLVLTTNGATVLWSFAALAVTLAYPFAKRFVSVPQAVLGIAFSFGIPMAFSAVHGTVPAVAWWLLAGNLFQQFYNTVDAWVVGNFVSNEAFSAVGTVGPIINMLIGFFMGLSSGAGVVISQ